ncbi:MAG: hypothetical protein ACLP74_00965 [Thermoplasmata archaeon]
MILPGLISLAFYRRSPSRLQIGLGLLATVVLSALLGYVSPGGPLGQWGSVVVAVIGGVVLYFAILAYLVYRLRRKPLEPSAQTPPASPP